jgi:hypothetical protein
MTSVTTLTPILLYSFLSYNFFSFFTLPPPLLFIYSRGFISPTSYFSHSISTYYPLSLLPLFFLSFTDVHSITSMTSVTTLTPIFLPFLQLLLFFYSSSTPSCLFILVFLFHPCPTFLIPTHPTTPFHSFLSFTLSFSFFFCSFFHSAIHFPILPFLRFMWSLPHSLLSP